MTYTPKDSVFEPKNRQVGHLASFLRLPASESELEVSIFQNMDPALLFQSHAFAV